MSASPERLWNRSFILCLLNNLFLFVYYFALLTILPVYIMKDLGGSVKEAGLALTLFLVSSIAVRPFSGMIIEKLGKKLAMRGAGVILPYFPLVICWSIACGHYWQCVSYMGSGSAY